jgi:aminoglycoside phosphotransferase (APT) family kinase protein
VIGAGFYLMEPVNGFNASGELPPLHAGDGQVRARMGPAMIDGLLALGEVDYGAVGLEGFGRPDGFLQRQPQRWQSHLQGYRDYAGWPGPDSLPGVEAIAAWLRRHCPQGSAPGIVHGDFHLANVMFSQTGPELAAIVDWELATLGDPLLDLAWMLVTWPGSDGRGAGTIQVQPWNGFASTEQLVAHYRAGSSRSLQNLDWYRVLAAFKLGILLEGSHARACAGKAPVDHARTHHASALRLLDGAMSMIH